MKENPYHALTIDFSQLCFFSRIIHTVFRRLSLIVKKSMHFEPVICPSLPGTFIRAEWSLVIVAYEPKSILRMFLHHECN
jgi:hypothetical protein